MKTVIAEMNTRTEQLAKYYKEVNKTIDVGKLGQILEYLLKISNYPMQPATEQNVAGYILKILKKGKTISIVRQCL